ncbi:metalloprotease mig-17-like [Lineus longissimus]|uniref:metalloprotease mig-17-like n=1 Tax=Lineus longissimus TaxID=88925 RepID=UPI002B4C3F13
MMASVGVLLVVVTFYLCGLSLAKEKVHETVNVRSENDGVEFDAFGKRFLVRRSADDDVTEADDVPVYAVKGNKLKEVHISDDQDTKIFKTKRSAVAVTSGESPTLKGWVMDGDEMIRISPEDSSSDNEENNPHTVEITEEPTSSIPLDYIDPHVPSSAEGDKVKRGFGRRGRLDALIELLVVVDNSIYRRVKEQKNGDENAAMRDIKIYYTLYVASINQRFQNIKDRELSISVVVTAIIVDKDRESAPWAEYFAFPAPDRSEMRLDAAIALDQFRGWIMDELTSLPQFDHAMAFTDYNLVRLGNVDTTGMAYVNTMCDLKFGYSVSVMQELGGFAAVGAATHELGHSLGSRHDGDRNSRDCPASMNNVMAPGNSNNVRVLRNFFYFSRCSVRQMRETIRNESSECLFNTRRSSMHHRTMKLPGQIVGVNKQCQQMVGEKSSFCAEGRFIGEMCFRLWCHDPKSGKCKTHGSMVAAHGTSCGDGKWCVNGQCTNDARAPKLESCHFGEMHKERCAQLIRQDIANCRDEQTKKMCCESCPKMMRMYYRF